MANFTNENGKYLVSKIKELLSEKQDALVSGESIKTINGESLLGAGDIIISFAYDTEYFKLNDEGVLTLSDSLLEALESVDGGEY